MPFDTEKQLANLNNSTFDIVRVGEFHNVRLGTVLSYLWVWLVMLLKLAVLGSDTYTCVCILVFKRWSTENYEIFDYKVAKWIFTGCILFRFLLLAWQLAWAIHIYRTKNIALAYLNNYSRIMYALRSYDYQCLFHDIELNSSLPWATFLVYNELDNALEVLVADCPREVINVMTLKKYATGGNLNSNVLENIQSIATTNLKLAIILSLILFSVVIYLFFFIKFCLGMLCYIPVKVKISHKGFKSIKAFCYYHVNEKVRFLVSRHHKPKNQLLLEGVLNIQEINANPLLQSNSTLHLLGEDELFTHPAYNKIFPFESSSSVKLTELSTEPASEYWRPPRAYTASSLRNNSFGSNSARLPLAIPDSSNSQIDLLAGRRAFTRTDSSNSQVDPFSDRRAFSRTQTSDTLMSDRSYSLADARPQGDSPYRASIPEEPSNPFELTSFTLLQKPDQIVEESALHQSEADIRDRRLDASRVSLNHLMQPQELVPFTGMDEMQNLSLERDETESPFSDHLQAPYPVRGVSKYFEHK